MNKKFKKEIKEWSEALVVAALLAIVIRVFVIEAFKIPTGSMRPTLLEGDHILVNKFIYGAKIPFTKKIRTPVFKGPQRGDIIVFIYPGVPKKNFIKRLVGLPGEKVYIKEGTVFINGKPLIDEKFQNIYYYNRGEFAGQEKEIKIPDDAYFVLGDNSASSQDSRYWGFVPQENIVGKALIIYWPFWRIRILK